MTRRQSLPEQWLITDPRIAGGLAGVLRRLPRGSGVVARVPLTRTEWRIARARELVVVTEGQGGAARVHDAREIRRARLSGARLLLLSPMFPTRSHPDWSALPRMRAAALARLGGRNMLALGGMDAARYRRIAPLGFIGWAGIDAWLGDSTQGGQART